MTKNTLLSNTQNIFPKNLVLATFFFQYFKNSKKGKKKKKVYKSIQIKNILLDKKVSKKFK